MNTDHQQQADKASEPLLLRMSDLPRICGISRSAIYRHIKEGTFPKGTHISAQTVVWKPAEIRKWADELVP